MAAGSPVQGNVEARLVFCLVVFTALAMAVADRRIAPESRATRWCWQYLDDVIFQAPPEDLTTIFAAIGHALQRFDLNLRPHKCVAHLPSYHGMGTPPAPPVSMRPAGETQEAYPTARRVSSS